MPSYLPRPKEFEADLKIGYLMNWFIFKTITHQPVDILEIEI